MEANMRLLSFMVASSMLLGASVAALAAHHRTHHYAYGPFASANGYGVYGHRGAHGARCPLRYGERPEELTQDRSYQESLGKPC
jgi:hypothetical protein